MPSDRDRFQVELDVNAGDRGVHLRHEARQERAGTDTFRIAIVGDFSGRGDDEAQIDIGPALAARRPVRVDRDSLDDAIAHFRPRCRWSVPDGEPIEASFTSLEDFHPDRLLDQITPLHATRDANARRAAGASVTDKEQAGRTAVTPSDLLESILGDTPLPPGGPSLAKPPAARDAKGPEDTTLTELVRRAVTPHLVDTSTAPGSQALAGEDSIVAERLRALLHAPSFQRLEALWRGVDFLTRRLETDERLQIHLIDLSRDELSAGLAADRGASALYRLLVDDAVGQPGGSPWSLLIGCYTFGYRSPDFDTLRRMASLARAAGAPFIAAAHPLLAGSPSFADTPDPEDWSDDVPREWSELRASADAAFVGLVLPRFLLRVPYGERTVPCERLRFEETPGDGLAEHDTYLWGNGAHAAALVLGQALSHDSALGRPSSVIRGLPLHVARRDGEAVAKPCTELSLSERDAARLLGRGLMPLLWVRDSDAMVLPRMQSIAMPAVPLALSLPSSRAAGRSRE